MIQHNKNIINSAVNKAIKIDEWPVGSLVTGWYGSVTAIARANGDVFSKCTNLVIMGGLVSSKSYISLGILPIVVNITSAVTSFYNNKTYYNLYYNIYIYNKNIYDDINKITIKYILYVILKYKL